MEEDYATYSMQYATPVKPFLLDICSFFPLLFFDFYFIFGKYQKLFCACEDTLVAMSNVTVQYTIK